MGFGASGGRPIASFGLQELCSAAVPGQPNAVQLKCLSWASVQVLAFRRRGRRNAEAPPAPSPRRYAPLKTSVMVDKERRRKLAFHLRQLSVGLATNDDFEEAVMEDVSDGWTPENYYRSERAKGDSDDPIIKPMLELCWGLYDDTRNHRLVGSDELTKEALKIIARCILFLLSDKEYEWPYFNTNNPLLRFSLKDLILSVLTLGHHYRNKREEHIISYYEWQKTGDYNVWPFFRQSDYEAALNLQPFLSGRQPTGA